MLESHKFTAVRPFVQLAKGGKTLMLSVLSLNNKCNLPSRNLAI